MALEVVSLGCRLNISESESLRNLLGDCDDLVVVNSCAVTSEAVRQTRQAIRKARRRHPQARLLVTGCAAEVERAALADMPEVDGLISNHTKLDPRSWNVAPAPSPAPSAAYTRAYVTAQNGCDHACTFCVIPQGRGASRSLAIPLVLNEVELHLRRGVREVVLTGIDLTSWGHDLPGSPSLGALVEAILAAPFAPERLRLSSLDGVEIDPLLLDLICSETRVMPHVHLSLQHGHDLILKRMKRRHSRADALALVEALRDRRPEIAIGADIIAGFPTEDLGMHEANLSILRELGIVHGHVFPYSPRPGTPAARMPQLGTNTIRARAAELRTVVSDLRADWLNSLIGKPLSVLAEKDGTGHAPNFARVLLPPGSVSGTIVTHTPTRISEGLLA